MNEELVSISATLGAFAMQIPALLVILGGAFFAVIKFSQYKKAAIAAILAALVGLFLIVISGISPFIIQSLISSGSIEQVPTVSIVFGVVGALGHALMTGILFVAIWLDRTSTE